MPKALDALRQRSPSMVATQEEILLSSSFAKKQPRTTDIRCPPCTASGSGSHPQPLAHSPLQIILSEHEQGVDGEAGFMVPLRSSTRKNRNRDFLALSLKREMIWVQSDMGRGTLTEDRWKDSVILSSRCGKWGRQGLVGSFGSWKCQTVHAVELFSPGGWIIDTLK